MNTHVNFETAKLLKEKGYSWECSHFYSKDKYDKEFILRTGTEYDSNRDPIWDWNLNGGKSGMLLKAIPYPNDDTATYYSAPTIAEVLMWLYEKHGIWIVSSYELNIENHQKEWFWVGIKDGEEIAYQYKSFNSPAEAYESAITYILEDLIQGGNNVK